MQKVTINRSGSLTPELERQAQGMRKRGRPRILPPIPFGDIEVNECIEIALLSPTDTMTARRVAAAAERFSGQSGQCYDEELGRPASNREFVVRTYRKEGVVRVFRTR